MSNETKKNVVIFGAAGSMGSSKKNFRWAKKQGISRSSSKSFDSVPGLDIHWGSIENYEDVRLCVEKADLIFNMAALIPPRCFKSIQATDETNLGGVLNIIKAIKETGGMETKRFINTSSVAVYGDRLPPYHVIKVGDPVYRVRSIFTASQKSRLNGH